MDQPVCDARSAARQAAIPRPKSASYPMSCLGPKGPSERIGIAGTPFQIVGGSAEDSTKRPRPSSNALPRSDFARRFRIAGGDITRMELRAAGQARFFVPLVLVLFSASAAHAQRVPEELFWCAGAALFAPFLAIPIKLGLVRLLALEADGRRLWSISVIEWVLWFPVAFLLLRSIRSSSVPLNLLGLFFSVVWLHRERVANARWSSAVYLALPTPVLALALPFAAFGVAAYLESLAR